MQKVNSGDDLKKQIAELEIRSKRQEAALKESLRSTGESIKQTLKPANLLKTGLDTVRHTPSIKTIALNTVIGLVAGYVTKRFVVGKSRSMIRKALGVIVQATITKMVHNKLPEWQNKAANMIAKQKALANPARITVR
jgi:hypothetical protein